MARVFVSYVHEDENVARAIKGAIEYDLKLEPGTVFLMSDTTQVLAGTDWLARIRQELTATELVILMMSARSVKRPWVNFEAGAAWLANKPLIPICYGNMSKDRLPKPVLQFSGCRLARGRELHAEFRRWIPGHEVHPVRAGGCDCHCHEDIRRRPRTHASRFLTT